MLSLLKRSGSDKPKAPTIEVADLDALVLEPVTIKLHGKSHILNPIDTITYLKFTNEIHKFYREENNYTPAEFVTKMHGIVSPLIPSITPQDIEKCSQTQVGALFNVCLNSVSGKLHTDVAQKKKAIKATQNS